MLTGLFVGLAVGAAPYPRLMLTVHIQFVLNGMASIVAALLLKSRLALPGPKGRAIVVIGHVLAWFVCLSEVAVGISGANKTLPIAAAQAGATGAAPWLETVIWSATSFQRFF